MTLNVIDLLLVAGFMLIVGLGFFGGVVRLTFVMLAVYLGVIVAGFFYLPVAAWLVDHLSALSVYTAQMVGFLFLLVVSTAAIAISLFKTFGTVRLPRFMASLDQIGGAALGIITATFTIVVTTVVLHVFFGVVLRTHQGGIEVHGLVLALAGQMQTSFLAIFFVELSAPLFVIILPWFPNGLPAILVAR